MNKGTMPSFPRETLTQKQLGGPGRRGMALVLVMGMIVLCTVLVVAFFFVVRVEGTSVRSASAKTGASDLAYSAVQIVEGMISHATDYRNDTTFAWACQPGMIRTYGTGNAASPNPLAYYKLYSSNKMVVTGSSLQNFNFSQEVDSLWDKEPACFTDLNSPIMVENTSSSGSKTPIFPIVDPRAMDMGIQGFNYSSSFANSSVSVNGVVPQSTLNTSPSLTFNDTRRLPMPVRWIYVLRDGTMVSPDVGGSTSATFQTASVRPSAANPIVGRVAFWTDDESSKINVNTASEGTFWDTPVAVSTSIAASGPNVVGEDAFQTNMPAANEFQRYGGHPATTCLSVVFAEVLKGLNQQAICDDISALVPQITGGALSSGGGTRDASTKIIVPDGDRLYPNIDDFVYNLSGTSTRTPQTIGNASPKQMLSYAQTCPFFLTANSKAPDLNMFGLPRVSIWPVWDNANASKRTNFDRAMLRASTLGSSTSNSVPMIFCRDEPLNQTRDYTQACTLTNGANSNQQVYEYLRKLTSRNVPGFGGTFGGAGAPKYNTLLNINGSNERDEILTEIFDYIRCTNLAEGNVATSYTNPTITAGSTKIGEVLPIKITPLQSNASTFGFGRMPTISELALVLVKVDSRKNTLLAEGGGNLLSSIRVIDMNDPSWLSSNSPVDPSRNFLLEWVLIPKLFCPMAGFTDLGLNLNISLSGGNLTVGGTPLTLSGTSSLANQGRFSDWNRDTTIGATIGVTSLVEHSTRGLAAAPPTSMFPTGLVVVPNSSPLAMTIPVQGVVNVTISAPFNAAANEPIQVVQNLSFNFQDPVSNNPIQFPYPTLSLNGTTWDGTFRTSSYGVVVPPATNTFTYNANNAAQNATRFDYVGSTFFLRGSDSARTLGPNGYVTIAGNKVYLQGDMRMLAGVQNQNTAGSVNAYSETLAKNPPVYPISTVSMAISSLRGLTNFTFPAASGRGQGGFLPSISHNITDSGFNIGMEVPPGLTQVSWVTGYIPPPYGGATAPGAANANTADWDNGQGCLSDGPYLNKPDDGTINGHYLGMLDAYYKPTTVAGYQTYSPYRQVPSPVMFGSLPSGLTTPWRTLLFRPAGLLRLNAAAPLHPGADSLSFNIPDHLFLDLFRMPIVQPRAISDPLSTEGKVNLNSQIAPFTYIVRDTGLAAILKSVMITALPSTNPNLFAKNYKNNNIFTSQTRYAIDPWQTLAQFHARFGRNLEVPSTCDPSRANFFITASQICDVPLIPVGPTGATGVYSASNVTTAFWANNLLTGDNSLERPYAFIYPRVTTQSNIFTVHVRAQTLKKISSDSNQVSWNENSDVILGEYRGSYTIERYFDPNKTVITDSRGNTITDLTNLPADAAIRGAKWRIVATKQFGQ